MPPAPPSPASLPLRPLMSSPPSPRGFTLPPLELYHPRGGNRCGCWRVQLHRVTMASKSTKGVVSSLIQVVASNNARRDVLQGNENLMKLNIDVDLSEHETFLFFVWASFNKHL
ncbi:hypothetical protein PR202_gb16108 [Eleusine coracana subsp. coracana]|uniref:Uncharacterized protein n=1 Tax=Eleusine coracana subsp. coracana TaxID=191504 RepID=A0AAV5F082_ELECO|nr:hypothetical protein PR202_gb16108 [Eleusine coracana subsp. coracana]